MGVASTAGAEASVAGVFFEHVKPVVKLRASKAAAITFFIVFGPFGSLSLDTVSLAFDLD